MYRKSNKVIDSVSSSELLCALHTLKGLSKPQSDFQISFSKQKVITLDDFPENARTVNFQQYMGNKSQVKMFKKTQNPYKNQLSPSPLAQQRRNIPPRTSSFKSRSHSPLDRRSQRTQSRVSHISKYSKSRPNVYKQNKKRQEIQKKQVQCPSFQSKKILDQREKAGISYVPIQHRAEQLLKEKQYKIAKLQKEKEFSRIIQEKECTFRPQIKPYKKSRVYQKEENLDHGISEFEKKRFEQCFIEGEFLCTPTQSFVRDYPERQLQQSLTPNSIFPGPTETPANPRKYKNSKFNHLLDLIQ